MRQGRIIIHKQQTFLIANGLADIPGAGVKFKSLIKLFTIAVNVTYVCQYNGNTQLISKLFADRERLFEIGECQAGVFDIRIVYFTDVVVGFPKLNHVVFFFVNLFGFEQHVERKRVFVPLPINQADIG